MLKTLQRAERILKDLEERKSDELAAMDLLAALAAEKDATLKAAQDSGLSARAFAAAWTLRTDVAMRSAGISPDAPEDRAGRLAVRLLVREVAQHCWSGRAALVAGPKRREMSVVRQLAGVHLQIDHL